MRGDQDLTLPTPGDPASGRPTAGSGLAAGRYLPQRLLGRGATKEVWLAHDLILERPVALSRVHAGAGTAARRDRLRQEARLMARLGDHRHIVTVHDALQDGGDLCLVARYMAGGSLAERLDAAPGRRLPVPEALRAARGIADALAHAHAHAVVHRDVKPANVWLDADGEAALGDFGIAQAADAPDPWAGRPAGTSAYAPPEQLAGGPAEPRSDLYGLGATLYELLCGHPPDGTPPASGVDEVDRLVLALLADAAAQRPASALEVRAVLDRLLGGPRGEPAPAAPRLVGRRAELARLRGALERAWAGELRAVAVAGEPGMGKTSLLDALAADAASRGLVLWGRCTPEGAAYGLWRGIVRTLLARRPDVGGPGLRRLAGEAGAPELAPGEEGRLRLFDAVVRLVAAAAAERPLLLTFDDVHWADATSLRLLVHLAAAAPAAPVLVVATLREQEVAPGHPLRRLLAELEGDPRVERIALHGLSEEEVGRFLPPQSSGLARTVHERSGGNPFYVAELARLLAGGGRGVPSRVREVVRARLDRLPAPTRDLLAVAAVAEGTFSVPGAARIAGLPPLEAAEALEPAVAAQVVEEAADAPGRHAFAHAIVRDAVYEALPPARRARLHEAVAGALRRRLEAGADVARADVARHALAAARGGADPQPAYAAAAAAGREARGVLGHEEAARHYADALEALDLGAAAPAGERLELLFALAGATLESGDIERARRRFQQAAAAARRAGSGAGLARAALGFSAFQPYGAIDEEAIALLQEALAALPAGDDMLRAEVTGVLAARLHPATDQERREALLDEAVAMARRLGGGPALTRLQSFAVMVNWRPERAALRRAAAEDVRQAAARVADHRSLLWAHVQRARDALQEGDVAAADAELDRARPAVAATRQSFDRWYLMVADGTRAAFGGRLREAAALAEEALALNRGHGEDCEQEHTIQGLVLAKLRWRPREANATALRGYASRYAALPVWEAMLALLEWDLGRPDAARRGLDACARNDFADVLRTPDWLAALALLGEAAAGADEPEHVLRLEHLLAPHAARNPVVDALFAALGPVARVLGLLAAADDRPAAAAARFADAVALADRWDAPAWALRAIGDWLWTGVPADRLALQERGMALARELELPWVAAELLDAAQITTP